MPSPASKIRCDSCSSVTVALRPSSAIASAGSARISKFSVRLGCASWNETANFVPETVRKRTDRMLRACDKSALPMILLIDDDPGIRNLLAAVLTREGVAHESAGDGAEAIERLRRRDFDAIVLDLLLPQRNGFEVLRLLEAD